MISSVAYLLSRRLLGCLMVLARREVSKDADTRGGPLGALGKSTLRAAAPTVPARRQPKKSRTRPNPRLRDWSRLPRVHVILGAVDVRLLDLQIAPNPLAIADEVIE